MRIKITTFMLTNWNEPGNGEKLMMQERQQRTGRAILGDGLGRQSVQVSASGWSTDNSAVGKSEVEHVGEDTADEKVGTGEKPISCIS